MARRAITLDEKIEKAEAAVLTAKVKYDAALDELEKLVTKRKELNCPATFSIPLRPQVCGEL